MSQTTTFDFLRLITLRVTDFDTLANAAQVCRTWRRVVNELLPKFMAKMTAMMPAKVGFKITKVRFLLDKKFFNPKNSPAYCNPLKIVQLCKEKTEQFPTFAVQLYNNTKSSSVSLLMNCVSEDDDYYVYESQEVPPAWRLTYLKYKIKWSEDGRNWQLFWNYVTGDKKHVMETGYHYPYADLSWQYFGTGADYQQPGEQVVIGSIGGFRSFHCCCAIQLLSLVNSAKC